MHRPSTRILGFISLALFGGALLSFGMPSTLAAGADCSATTSNLVPISDLGPSIYHGEVGGLYPGGTNETPQPHLELGLRLAQEVRPLDTDGEPDPDGAIVLLAIGVSNTRIEFQRFMSLASAEPRVDDRLVLVNGAQGARALDQWSTGPDADTWRTIDADLERHRVDGSQVQVAWMKLPDRSRGTVSLDDVGDELDQLVQVLQIARAQFPNLRLVYLSSRIYGGYGGAADSEPKAYQHGFAVKKLIELQINGDMGLNADPAKGPVVSPWIDWGPYLWADGLSPRSDGLVWRCDDFDSDGIHPGQGAADKVASLLMSHFMKHPTSSGWFIGRGSARTGSREATAEVGQSHRDRSGVDPGRTGRAVPVDAIERETRDENAPVREITWFAMAAAIGFAIGLTVVMTRAGRSDDADLPKDPEGLGRHR
jgi:hypothetical protein